jgi:hypothetical protein
MTGAAGPPARHLPAPLSWPVMLTALLLMLVLGFLLALVALGVGVGLVVRSIAQRNRLHPSIETGAPLTWCWSPRATARLHRRLQGALETFGDPSGDRRPSSADGSAELVAVLAHQAAAVDRELITAHRSHGPRRRAHLRGLRADVRQVEHLSQRMQHQRRAMGADGIAASPSRRVVLDGIRSRLDLLAEAHAELLAVEQASTGSDPDVVLRRITAPSGPVARVGGQRPGPHAVPEPAVAFRNVR